MSPLDLPKTHSDTERLDFLLRFMSIDDVGDDCAVPGIVVNSDEMEEELSTAPPDEHGRRFYLCEFGDDLRTVVDRALEAHNDTSLEDAGSAGGKLVITMEFENEVKEYGGSPHLRIMEAIESVYPDAKNRTKSSMSWVSNVRASF